MEMRINGRHVSLILVAVGVLGCGSGEQEQDTSSWSIDQRSYTLGGIGAFAEMVGAGVKQLALSAPLEPAEMDAIIGDAERIAEDNGAAIYREEDFLVTDLFPAGLTEGKHVLLICHDSTFQKYMDLKREKQQLQESGRYDENARLLIARRFGKLLSYSDAKVESLLEARDGS